MTILDYGEFRMEIEMLMVQLESVEKQTSIDLLAHSSMTSNL